MGRGDCHSGWRDLLIALGSSRDDCDTGLLKIPSKDTPHPSWVLLEVALKTTRLFQNSTPPPTWGRREDVHPAGFSQPPRGGAASAPRLLLQSGQRRLSSFLRLRFPLRTSRGQKLPGQPLDADAASVPALCLGNVQCSARCPRSRQSLASASLKGAPLQLLSAAIICRGSWRGVPDRGCPLLAPNQGEGHACSRPCYLV